MRERKKRRALLEQGQEPYTPKTSEPAYPLYPHNDTSYPQNDTYKIAYAHHEPTTQHTPQELETNRVVNEAP
jgi:hypothetical protein